MNKLLRLIALSLVLGGSALVVPAGAQVPSTSSGVPSKPMVSAPVLAPGSQTVAPPAPGTNPATTAAAPAPGADGKLAKLPAGSKVDINSASAVTLDLLPQIGPARAKKIIENRPYVDLDDLVKKKVLSQGIFDKAKDGMALASINSSSAADLAKTLPGIGDVRAKEIVAGRPYASVQELVSKKILTEGVFDKIKGLIAL